MMPCRVFKLLGKLFGKPCGIVAFAMREMRRLNRDDLGQKCDKVNLAGADI
jgi:hypothetical protein